MNRGGSVWLTLAVTIGAAWLQQVAASITITSRRIIQTVIVLRTSGRIDQVAVIVAGLISLSIAVLSDQGNATRRATEDFMR
jgi:hypothetical protein